MEIREAFDTILPAGHPSFGTSKAVFLFALGNGPTRILSVEATNPWAVLCLERLLLGDGKASDNCRVLQVIREYRNVGTRDEMAEEIPFGDFMLDIADMDRLMGGSNDDMLVLEAFKNALSKPELDKALLKLQNMRNLPEDPFDGYVPESETVPVALPALPAPEPVPADSQKPAQLTSALVGLGFKKSEVREFVTSLGDQVHSLDMHSLIRQGLRALAA